MYLPTIYSKDGSTGVFWDVEDYPFPEELVPDPVTIYGKVKKELWDEDYHGKLTIRAYVADKTKFNDGLVKKYKDAGIEIEFFPAESKRSRIWCMMVDIIAWSFENPPPANPIVFSKHVGVDESVLDILQAMYDDGYGLLLSDPEPDFDLAEGSSQWLWNSLYCDDTLLSKI